MLVALRHKSDREVLEALVALNVQDQQQDAAIVAHLAEAERRRLHVPLGYDSLYRYCLGVLHMSANMAYARIRVARAARRYPELLDALAAGRVHVHGARLLAPFLKRDNVGVLLAAATHRTSREIEALLAERFPKPDAPTLVMALPSAGSGPSVTPLGSEPLSRDATEPLVARPVVPLISQEAAERTVPVPAPPTRVAPTSPGRYLLQVTLTQQAHDLMRRAQELLAHAQPGAEVSEVLERALREMVERLERRRFGDTDFPRPRRAGCDTRTIPAEIKRRVAERDGKRCTFVSRDGHRCEAREQLEYDHVVPFARGGRSTFENLRLRCRTHNQATAEQVYGEGFMREKREARVSSRASSGTRPTKHLSKRETEALPPGSVARARPESASRREPWGP